MGSADVTRRWGVAAGGEVLFPGLTRPEANAAATWLATRAPDERRRSLVQIELPVVLSGGAGPHLLDSSGTLILGVGVHPSIAGALVSMGPAEPLHPLGLVERSPDGGFRWVVLGWTSGDGRVAALDALDACMDPAAAETWERMHAGPSG